MGLGTSKHIARIIVDPIDHDVVYVAALGSLWGRGGERGVFKTTDGGLTWTRVLFVDDDTGATELVMDPSNNKVIYAATYQRRRATWGFNGGGLGSAMWKSSDAGRHLDEADERRPDRAARPHRHGRLSRQPEHRLRAHRARQGERHVSIDDAGQTWRKMSDTNPRPMYFSQIRIDPKSDARIYVLGVDLHISDDGGKTFYLQESMHDDHHAMWINPNNPNHIIEGTDGGLASATTAPRRSRRLQHGPRAVLPRHLRHGDALQRLWRLQDNYSWGGPSAVRSRAGHHQRRRGSRCRAATASTCRSIRRIRAPLRESQDGTFRASIASPTSARPIRPWPRAVSRRLRLGTGTRRS
jgi:hypothetical protein